MQITDEKMNPFYVLLSNRGSDKGTIVRYQTLSESGIAIKIREHRNGSNAHLTAMGDLAEATGKYGVSDTNAVKMISALNDAESHLLDALVTLDLRDGHVKIGKGTTLRSFDKYKRGENEQLDQFIDGLTLTHAYLENASQLADKLYNERYRTGVVSREEPRTPEQDYYLNAEQSIRTMQSEIIQSLDTILPGAGQNALKESSNRLETIQSESNNTLFTQNLVPESDKRVEMSDLIDRLVAEVLAGKTPNKDAYVDEAFAIRVGPRGIS